MSGHAHIPVLLDEVVGLLAPQEGETVVDCTAGLGGHAEALGRAVGPSGVVVLNDLDPGNLAHASERVRATGARVEPIHGNFGELARSIVERGLVADVVLADLGFASIQVDDPGRGLSFSKEGPLDMRLNPGSPVTAEELVNTLPEGELADLIYRFGEERMSRRIAAKVVAERKIEPIQTTTRLATIVRSACGRSSGRIDPATRTFQALRIAVNDEIGSLEALLASVRRGAEGVERGTPGWLASGARVGVISFHSLEDRPVKRAFGSLVERGLAVALTRKPVTAGEEEVAGNPRSRSAKLRVVRIGSGGGA